ncbi:MAG: bifunctional enoyl-CoA hydratase/phosphate acetyltransferase [Pseudomonadota bacterium]
MIKDFQTILCHAREAGPKVLAVAAAEDAEVLSAVERARQEGIIVPILVGDKVKTESLMKESDICSNSYEIIDIRDSVEACGKAVELVRTGRALTLMKGFVDTSVILKAVLNKDTGLKPEGLLSHVGVLKTDKYDRFFILSDSAINISPSLEDKACIIANAVEVAHALGNMKPKVALICPVEKVNEKIISTVHAAELVKMNQSGLINGCIVGGPFALDNAVSLEAAKHKGIAHPVAGRADILITPNLEVGNVLNKAMEYFGNTEKAGIIMGAGVPIVLTSRASSSASKLNSIALAALVADKGGNL